MKHPSSLSVYLRATGNSFLFDLRRELRRVADPSKAAAMRAYMKSAIPYLGVTVPLLRRTCGKLFAELTFPNREEWRQRVLQLWRGARFREERYAAIILTGVKDADAFQIPQEMPLYEEIIATGAWWDFVDEVASHRVGPILRAYPAPMRKKMLAWSKCDNLWKRRAAILCQLRFKRDTDLDLLYACIEPSLDSNEFFLRKAIGWALRQYAWTDPAAVRKYVRSHKRRLSGLSRREALKNLIYECWIGRSWRIPPVELLHGASLPLWLQ